MPSSACKKCALDRKSTRLNSSHTIISYAVFCLKKIHARREACPPAPRPSRDLPPRAQVARVSPHSHDGGGRGPRRVVEPRIPAELLFFLERGRPPIPPLFPHDRLPE